MYSSNYDKPTVISVTIANSNKYSYLYSYSTWILWLNMDELSWLEETLIERVHIFKILCILMMFFELYKFGLVKPSYVPVDNLLQQSLVADTQCTVRACFFRKFFTCY